MKIISFGASIKGNDHIENEDSFLSDDDLKLYAVADGVTFPGGGKKAADLSATFLQKLFSKNLLETFKKVNQKILDERKKNSAIGYTTLTAAHIEENAVDIVNLGDSPAYLVRNNQIQQIFQSDRFLGHSLAQVIGSRFVFPHHTSKKVKKDDLIVLITDGISDVLSEEEILHLVKGNDLEKIAKNILNEATKIPTIYNDDKTIVLVKIKN